MTVTRNVSPKFGARSVYCLICNLSFRQTRKRCERTHKTHLHVRTEMARRTDEKMHSHEQEYTLAIPDPLNSSLILSLLFSPPCLHFHIPSHTHAGKWKRIMEKGKDCPTSLFTMDTCECACCHRASSSPQTQRCSAKICMFLGMRICSEHAQTRLKVQR